ncbi:DUF3488 and transglutaminase-like domain-containing protein [Lapillicoccus sp.]|uniref:transglutaminase family protein n=1 Tax=Lapillicoccus sp. TaxID=1909287 RepID=UPI0032644ABE
MTRYRPSDAFVAALATVAAVLGLTTLTENASWVAPSLWVVLIIVVVGVVGRRLTSSGLLVLGAQLVLGTWTVLLISTPDQLWFGLPGPQAWARIGELGRDVAEVMQRYAAPIPLTEGVQLLFVAVVGILALVVDYVAVTRSSPAVAGLPLLATFLTAAANSGSSLAPWYFVVAAAAWLLLVSRQGSWAVRRWSTTVAAPRTPSSEQDVESEALGGYGSVARQLAFAALVLAVVLPAVVPHLPTRYVLDGLGRADNSVGRGGRVGFNSTLDLTRSLESGSENVVMTYRTSATSPPPLRVAVAPSYSGGEWRSRPRDVAQPSQAFQEASQIAPSVRVSDKQVAVESNGLAAPNVAAPQPVVSADLGDTVWGSDPLTDDIFAAARPDSYSLVYREVDVTGLQLQTGVTGGASGRGDPEIASSLVVDPESAGVIQQLLPNVTAGKSTTYDKAVAIQDWLRTGGGFTYSLQLADISTNPALSRADPITAFLLTKQGYCVQFASTMIMMARAEGIPARMSIGFLPGQLQNGLYTVRSADAHAWPELYFPGAGWLRFEPTPASRTGAAPSYTSLPSNAATGNGAGSALDPAAGTAAATSAPREVGAPESNDVAAGTSISWTQRVQTWLADPRNLVLLAVLLGLLGTLVLPVTARIVARRRRSRAANQAELAEAQWDELVSRLGDLGVPPPLDGGTLRQWRHHYVREAYLDEPADAAMGHVVATLERSRYARPNAAQVELGDDIKVVTKSAAASRPPLERVRAFFLPAQGVRWWTRGLAKVTDAPGRWIDALADRLPRRRPR